MKASSQTLCMPLSQTRSEINCSWQDGPAVAVQKMDGSSLQIDGWQYRWQYSLQHITWQETHRIDASWREESLRFIVVCLQIYNSVAETSF